jgi:hypothetical protein
LNEPDANGEAGDEDKGHGLFWGNWLFDLNGLEAAACVKGARCCADTARVAISETSLMQEIKEIDLQQLPRGFSFKQ